MTAKSYPEIVVHSDDTDRHYWMYVDPDNNTAYACSPKRFVQADEAYHDAYTTLRTLVWQRCITMKENHPPGTENIAYQMDPKEPEPVPGAFWIALTQHHNEGTVGWSFRGLLANESNEPAVLFESVQMHPTLEHALFYAEQVRIGYTITDSELEIRYQRINRDKTHGPLSR